MLRRTICEDFSSYLVISQRLGYIVATRIYSSDEDSDNNANGIAVESRFRTVPKIRTIASEIENSTKMEEFLKSVV